MAQIINTRHKKPRKHKYSTLKQALEPRMLFDASLVPVPADPAVTGTNGPSGTGENALPETSHPVQPVEKAPAVADNSVPKNPLELEKNSTDITNQSSADQVQEFFEYTPPAKELIFIDARLKNADTLIEGLSPYAEVHFLNSNEDGIEQIDSIIKSSVGPISSIHILSHGGSGAVDLGSTLLTSQNLSGSYAEKISSWGTFLKDDANVLLYGCGVAEGYVGQKFVTDLSEIIGRDVAASIDPTGNNLLGGNWDLEFQTGPMSYGPTDVFSQQALAGFYYVLAKPVLDLNGPAAFTATDTFLVRTPKVRIGRQVG